MVIKMTEVRLGQIANIFTGKCNAQDAVDDGIYPLFDRSGEVKKSDKYFTDCEAIIVPGESTTFIPRYYKGKFNLHQRAYCINPHEDVNGVFLYYLIKANSPYFFSVATGATVASLRLNNFLKMKLNLPLRQVQDKIADILSTYDKLIENNNKRIAILEQEAEELYKEWFVRFRFPGNESRDFKNVQIRGWTLSDSNYLNIPSNWKFCSFSKIGSFIRGKNITSDKMIPGNIPVISAGLEPSGFHNESNVKGPSITISASGANAGYMSLHFSDIWAADCSYYQSADWLWFAYSSLKFLQPVITNMQTGAAQPHVYPKHIDKLFIVIPDKDILGKYNLLVEPIFNEIKNLQEQNAFLGNQRDYLLPRLISGKLEVN